MNQYDTDKYKKLSYTVNDINGIEIKEGNIVERHIERYDNISIGKVECNMDKLWFHEIAPSEQIFVNNHPLDVKAKLTLGDVRKVSYTIIGSEIK